MQILILGTSNSLLRNGWTAGLREALPDATIDNRSIGGAPSFQFGGLLDSDFSRYDVVFFDSVPNDEKASEDLSTAYLDRLAYEVIATIAAQTKVILLGIPMDRHFLTPSPVYEQRRRIAELCGAQFIGLRELMRQFGRALVGPDEALFETQSHPAHRIAAMFGRALGEELAATLSGWPAMATSAPSFAANFGAADAVALPNSGRVVERSNSLLSAMLVELAPGESVTVRDARPCLGFYMNVDGTRAAVELASPAGRLTVEHWFDLVEDKVELRFMPLTRPLALSRLTVTNKWRGGKGRRTKKRAPELRRAQAAPATGATGVLVGRPEAAVPDLAGEQGDCMVLHRRVEAVLAARLPAAAPSDESTVPAEAFMRLGRFDFAAEAYERAAANAPLDPVPLDAAADAWLQYGDLGRAVDCLALSARIMPSAATALQLARTLVRLRRNAEAVAAFETVMALEPGPAIALELGRLLLEGGDHEAARTHLEIAASADVDPEAQLLLGRTMAALKEHEAAARAFSRFLAHNPRHGAALYHLAKAQMARRQFSEAIVNLMAASEVQPANIAVTRELARAHAGMGDHMQAVLLLQPLVDGGTADWACLITYGRAATALKRRDLAAGALQQAANLKPDDPATIKALEQALALAS